jgi:hypothetical protein
VVDIIDTIFSVGQKIFGLKLDLSKARLARKEIVTEFLNSIAQSIADTSALLKQGIYPHGKCQEILLHSEQMEAAIGDLIGEVLARDLASQLAEVHQVERLYGELSTYTDADKLRKLNLLDQAAGQFRASAAFVKVSP